MRFAARAIGGARPSRNSLRRDPTASLARRMCPVVECIGTAHMSRRSSRFGCSTTRSHQPWRYTRTSTAFCNFPSARPAVSFIAVDSPAFRKRPLATYRGPRRNVSAPTFEPIVYRACAFGLTLTESRVHRVRGDRRTCRRHSRASEPDRARVFTISLSEVFDTRLRQK
jgi:hypothetical protein